MEEPASPVTTTKSWYKKWWGILILVAFFPFTLSYLAWKQKWSLPVRLGVIGLIWIVFIGMGSSNKPSNTTSAPSPSAELVANTTPNPTQVPEKVGYSLEQKQEDFKTFYAEYQKQGGAVLAIQITMSELGKYATSKEDLYLALDKMSQMQKNLSSANMDIKIPESLKEYKDLRNALVELAVSSSHFSKAIDQFMEYVNKDDLSKLKDAKNRSDMGVQQLTASSDKVEAVAKELGVDTSLLKTNQ